jgi:hypothetical protein
MNDPCRGEEKLLDKESSWKCPDPKPKVKKTESGSPYFTTKYTKGRE